MKTAHELVLSRIIDPSWIYTTRLSFDELETISNFFEGYRDEPSLKAVISFD